MVQTTVNCRRNLSELRKDPYQYLCDLFGVMFLPLAQYELFFNMTAFQKLGYLKEDKTVKCKSVRCSRNLP